jgi:hypothetical protein
MADSQRIALQANYENDLNALERQRLATVDELQRAIANAQLSGDLQAAQELSSYLQQVQGQWVNYLQNQQAMENENYWMQQSIDADNQNRAREMAMMIMQSGGMPDDDTLNAAGISRAQAQALLGTTAAQVPVATTVTTAKNTGGTTRTAGGNNAVAENATESAPAAGMNPAYFSAFASSLAAQLQSGKEDAAQANIASRWNELSEAQRESVYGLLNRFGY